MIRKIVLEVDDALLGQRMKVEGKAHVGSLTIDMLGPVIVDGLRARSTIELREWGITLIEDVQM